MRQARRKINAFDPTALRGAMREAVKTEVDAT